MGDVESCDEEEVGDGEETDMTRRVEKQGDREYEEIYINKDIKSLGDEYMEDEEEDSKQGVIPQTEGLGDEFEDDHEVVVPTLLSQEDGQWRISQTADVLLVLDGRGGVASIVDYSSDTEKQNCACLNLSFDMARKRVDMIHVLRQATGKPVVYEVKNIKRFFVLLDKGKMILNIDAMFHDDHILDIKKMACNNIHEICYIIVIIFIFSPISEEMEALQMCLQP